MSKKAAFTPDMKIIAAIFAHPDAHTVFRKHGLKCVHPKYADSVEPCVASEKETMKEGAELHGFDIDAVLKELNELPPPQKKTESEPKAS
ncbi:MAG: DUF1858 domain-containing protein [Planctomycetota bacterium]|jgi:hybrid cluster-associated redox disulfide protein